MKTNATVERANNPIPGMEASKERLRTTLTFRPCFASRPVSKDDSVNFALDATRISATLAFECFESTLNGEPTMIQTDPVC